MVVGCVVASGLRFNSASKLSNVAAIRRWSVTNCSRRPVCRAASFSLPSASAASIASAAGFSVSTTSVFCTIRFDSSNANDSATCFI